MANLCHLFLHQQSFSSSISLSSIFKPTQPDVFSQMNQISSILRGWTSKIFQFLCMWLFLLIILVVIFIFSNLSSPLLNMKRFLLKNISTEDSLTNLTTHLSEKHGQDSSVEGKKKNQLLCNVISMNFQTDLTSKPFHHLLQHILTAKISKTESI